MLDQYLSHIGDLVKEWGYWIIFFGLSLEATVIVGLIVPGLFILIFAGYHSALGSLNFGVVLLCSLAGTIVGDALGYFLGYKGLMSLNTVRRMSERFAFLETAIRESSGWFLFFYHFPAFSRMVVPPLLGLSNFGFRRFFWRDLVGATLFVLTYGTIGYMIGLAAQALQDAIDIGELLQTTFLLLLAWWVVSIVFKVRRRSREGS